MRLKLAPSLLLAAFTVGAQQVPRLDTTTFVVLGEGLAAGMANFGLSEAVQDKSFPAQMARQMKTAFPQPLIQGPGLGDVLGYPSLPTRLPTYPANTVRVFPTPLPGDDEAPPLFVFNLSVPGMRVFESVSRKPVPPLVHEYNNQQTLINMLLGFPALILERNVPLWTQIEYAEAMNPTLALVELGYYEALEAAVSADPSLIPTPAAFRPAYTTIVSRLRALHAQVIVTTIPDPIDTAYFTLPESAANNLLKTAPAVLLLGYDLQPDDYITRNGLSAIGSQLLRQKIEPLPPASILRASVAAQIRSRVQALNVEIAVVAREHGAVVYDLAALTGRLRASGLAAAASRVTADYLGGFYSLDGFYPGATGHALIANDLIALLNRTYSAAIPPLDLNTVSSSDPVIQFKPARGPVHNPIELGFSGDEVNQ